MTPFITDKNRPDMTAAMELVHLIKGTVSGLSKGDVREMMTQHFRQLRLIGKSGKWKTKELEKLGDFLLPNDLNGDKVKAFVDQVARQAETNQYLNDFFEKAQGHHFDHLYRKVRTEGDAVFPSVVTYALVLERLTEAMRDDWRIIECCKNVWKKARVKVGLSTYISLFERIKLTSVEIGIHLILQCHKSRKVPSRFCRVILPVNIIEAMIADIRLGYKDNAASGLPLAINLPGAKKFNPKTGAAQSHWSKDKKVIHLCMSLPGKWADLYSTWNLAFVSRYRDFPYFMAKLLIPQVASYQDSPEEFIYNRALALYTQCHYAFLGRSDLAKQGKEAIQWNDRKLTEFWGKVNKESARNYSEDVRHQDPSWGNRFKAKLQNSFM
ncbi:hypothetical protein DSLASN_09300 [Desulfoluna limicola]|uniref:Uncharacterized protein n=1 Tax=Desulfoluna limicola TaxID=2810562 RepID=A0ABM7PCP2_9BACT|nr:hypothetical protein [Desulfoluna limicola]BCS95298.1 hypothetical protein DSLASN_09300 [Desulfoluna limicola]